MPKKAKNTPVQSTTLDEQLEGCYGGRLSASDVKEWLSQNILDNIERKTKITLNVMGAPGTAKTDTVKSMKNHPVDWNGKHYDGFEVIDIPLAQIEEMGDVLGFPVEEIKMSKGEETRWIKAADSLIRVCMEKGWEPTGEQRTVYAPPAWVPKEERPGILLFDDGNRASPQIIKGLMQLVQDYRTISWSIPNGWTIVFTGNPDNTINQVTSMDTAQLTRMKFVTMVPDPKEWAQWAENNDIDGRLISFVLSYPEMMVSGTRTNPRSLAEFGRALKRFPVLDSDKLKKCIVEAKASLDDDTVTTLVTFLTTKAELVIEPLDILERYDAVAKANLKNLISRKEPRIDIVNILNDRLYAYLVSDKYGFKEEHVKNFQSWIMDKNNPRDFAYAIVKQLCLKQDFKYKRNFLQSQDKEIQKQILKIASSGTSYFPAMK